MYSGTDPLLTNIVYMGKTGQGKSTLCNTTLFGYKYIDSLFSDDSDFKPPFDVSSEPNSCTSKTTFLDGVLLG